MALNERTHPVIKPRAPARKPSNRDYDYPKTPVTFSKLCPHNIQATETLNRHLNDPSAENGNELPPDFPSEDEVLSLTTLIEKYSHLLPLRVKAVSGFMAENEGDPTICIDDVYNIHALKQAEVVTIVDSRRQKYSLPLHSAAKFGLIGKSAKVYSVLDLQNASPLPPVIATMSKYSGTYAECCFSENEVLLPLEVVQRPQGGVLVKVFSVRDAREKLIPGPHQCDLLFSTQPAVTKLYLSDIIQYASHLLPCQAQLFISQDQAKLPKHLTSKMVTVEPKRTVSSLIITLHQKYMIQEDKVYIDIPVSIDIDVRVLRPEPSEKDYVVLFQDSRALVEEYDPKKLQACVNANDDDTYITQAQLFKALRQGYETAGTKIKTSGIERDGHIYEPLSDIRPSSSVYQDVVFPEAQQKTSKKLGHQLPEMIPNHAYEVVSLKSEETDQKQLPTPSKRRMTLPPPVTPRTKQPPTSTKPPKKQVLPPVSQPKETPSSSPALAQLKAAPPSPKSQRKIPPTPPLPQPKVDLPSTQVKTDTPLHTAKPAVMAPTPQTITAKKPIQSIADKPKNAVPLPPRVREQTQSASPPTVESPVRAPKNSSKQNETTNGEVSPDQISPVRQEVKTGIVDKSSSDQALLAINESLRLLLTKVEKIEQKQTKFETDIALLKHQESTATGQGEIPQEVCFMTQQDVLKLLEAMDLPQYREAFSKEWVDGEVFKDLDEEALQELGVASKLHRLKLMKVITGAYPLDKYFK